MRELEIETPLGFGSYFESTEPENLSKGRRARQQTANNKKKSHIHGNKERDSNYVVVKTTLLHLERV